MIINSGRFQPLENKNQKAFSEQNLKTLFTFDAKLKVEPPLSISTFQHSFFNTFCMKILPFRAVLPNLDRVPHSNDFFDTVKFRYHDFAAEGLFEPAEPDAMYIYQIRDADGRKFTGLIAAADINEYLDGNIRLHEKTIVENEAKQAELLRIRGAAIKPILLTYPADAELNALIINYLERHRKFFVIELGGDKHRFWQITEGLVLKKIRQIFNDRIPHVYLADGHHRSASFAELYQQQPTAKTEKLPCAFFADNELKINAFHRLVRDLNGLSADDFLEKLATVFTVEPLENAALPTAKFELTMYVSNKWFRLKWLPDVLKNFAEGLVQLDVHLLNEKVLKPILGIKNIRADKRMSYLEGGKSLKSIEKATTLPPSEGLRGENTEGCVFCLFPVEFSDLKAVVDSEGTMPPKSTFFEPRMKNGLLVYEI